MSCFYDKQTLRHFLLKNVVIEVGPQNLLIRCRFKLELDYR